MSYKGKIISELSDVALSEIPNGVEQGILWEVTEAQKQKGD